MQHSQTSIIGLGEVIYDHIFLEEGDGVYLYSRGGGPIWNVLAELSLRGMKTFAVGAGGSDIFGRLCLTELKQLGVDISRLGLVPSKRTRVVFEHLQSSSRPTKAFPKHSFHSSKCLVCGARYTDRMLATFRELRELPEPYWSEVDVVCVDRLTKERISVIHKVKQQKAISVLDLGRIGYLRFVPSAQILATIGLFDIVTMPESVAKSLAKRSRMTEYARFLEVGQTAVLCITKAEKGLELFIRQEGGTIRTVKIDGLVAEEYADTAGAGDTFLARFLVGILDGAKHCGEIHRLLGDIDRVVDSASSAVLSMEDSLRTYGARGHMKLPRTASLAKNLTCLRGRSLGQLRELVRDREYCMFCDSPGSTQVKKVRSSKKVGSRRNVADLLRRVFISTDRRDSLKKCSDVLDSVKSGFVIGTGGSFPAAWFIAQLIQSKCKVPIVPMRPYDYTRLAVPTDTLVVVTYSGNTHDCRTAIERAKQIGTKRIALVTGTSEPKLASLLRKGDIVIPYGQKARERGFVSIAGTVSPCALWTAAAEEPSVVAKLAARLESRTNGGAENVEEMATSLNQHKVVDVFGGAWAWAAMLDIESKLTESGVGTTQLHESKDFSHGRFILVM